MCEQTDNPVVSKLWVYPLKSASGIRLDQAEVDARGFALDRRWMLVDAKGGFITQRKHPRLALIGCAMSGENLVLTRPDGSALEVPLRLAVRASVTESIQVRIWGSECRALRVGQQADGWFSEFLGVECRLVFMPESTRRRVDSESGSDDDIVSFADGYPFLLVGQSSLDDLNGRLAEPVPLDRFRPNIVVETDVAFAEDTWTRIRIGEVVFRVAGPCARCTVTTTDQATGERGKEPLATLAGYRRFDGKILFGQNLIQENRGKVRVGDEVEKLRPRQG